MCTLEESSNDHPKVTQRTTPLQSSSSAQGWTVPVTTAPENFPLLQTVLSTVCVFCLACPSPGKLCFSHVAGRFFPFRKESLLALLNARKGSRFHSCKISFLAAIQLSGEKKEEKKKSQLGMRRCQDVLSAGVVLTAGPC